jgi:hypothetical protein
MRTALNATLAAALVTLAGLAPAAQAADPGAEVAKSYTVKAAVDPASLKAGAAGKVTFTIAPTGEVHVDPKAPLKVTLEASPGLKLQKTQLGRADSVQAGQGVTFAASFTATAAGKQEVKAKLDFFLCTDQWCVKQLRDVTVVVDVQ